MSTVAGTFVSKQSLDFGLSRRDLLGSALLLSSAMAPSNTKTDVHWGIVGLGDVCQKKSGPSFYKCHGSQLEAVMRRTPNKAGEWARANVPGGEC